MPPSWSPQGIVDEIISELSLNKRGTLAKITEADVEILQSVFDKYIGIKTGLAPGDIEYAEIMSQLCERLQKTPKLRIAK